jgi:hypothetical protein
MTTGTSFVDDLRPKVQPFDPEWSAETLAAIFAEPVAEPRTARPRRLFLITLPIAAALALAAVIAPSLLTNGNGGPGASASATEILTKAAGALENQIPTKGQYLNVKHVDRYWTDGKERASRGTFEDWVPGDRAMPMIEQTTEDGRITDTTPQPLGEYNRPYYTDYPSDPRKLLDALNQAAIQPPQDSDTGDRLKNIWDQAFRELQGAAVPVEFKAAILRALTKVPGVTTVPTKNSVGDLQGTALIFKREPLAFIFDKDSGVFLGMSMGIDNPNAPKISNQTTSALVTKIVESAPTPDYELEDE